MQPAGAESAGGSIFAQRCRLIAACGICILFWGLTGLQGIRSFEMVEQRYTKQYAELFDYISQLDADQIYVYGSYKAAADVQTRTVEKEVIRLSDDFAQIDDVESGDYVVLETETASQYGLDKLEVCYEYLDYVVCRK
jgi:phosphoribosylformylglycinamidine (FGAM) synthase PurS component